MPRFERLPIEPPIEPMEARQHDEIPTGAEWRYEPKWDGFRCIAFRDGDDVELQSKSGQSLTRYFPEIVESLRSATEDRFVLDGELYIEIHRRFDFDALLQRIHPAASRVRTLAKTTPASYAVFDLLVEGTVAAYESLLDARRERLARFLERNFPARLDIVSSPSTREQATARTWLAGDAQQTDGVIAKRNVAYAFGTRDAMVKVKRRYTADCVVGGFRGSAKSVASLLLGLYDDDGLLHHVGFVGSMDAAERKRATELLVPRVEAPGFTGSAPGGPSRWRRSGSAEWSPVRPEIVVEVSFDHVTAQRFRHAARFLRWRPDKSPRTCSMEQLLRVIEAPKR